MSASTVMPHFSPKNQLTTGNCSSLTKVAGNNHHSSFQSTPSFVIYLPTSKYLWLLLLLAFPEVTLHKVHALRLQKHCAAWRYYAQTELPNFLLLQACSAIHVGIGMVLVRQRCWWATLLFYSSSLSNHTQPTRLGIQA